jgi:hypothetical protein
VFVEIGGMCAQLIITIASAVCIFASVWVATHNIDHEQTAS